MSLHEEQGTLEPDPARSRVRMRRFLTAVVVMFGVLLGNTVASLALTTSRMHRSALLGVQRIEHARQVLSLRVQLRRYLRETSLAPTPGGSARTDARYQVDATLRHLSARAGARSTTDRERELLRAVIGRSQRFLEEWSEGDTAAALARYREASARLDAMSPIADDLHEHYLAEEELALRESASWETLSKLVALVALTLALALSVVVGILSLRWIYRPLVALCGVMARYQAGDLRARAGGATLDEVSALGGHFNALADALAQKDAERYRLVGSVAHDLRNALSAVRMVTAPSMLARALSPEDLRKALGIVQRGTAGLNRLADDLVDTARLESGRLSLSLATTDLRDLGREAVALFQPLAPGREFALELPPSPVRVACDPARIAQVLNNLLSNACKYTPEGGRVIVTVVESGREASVAVADSGIGIGQDDLKLLFTPFHRARGVADSVPGLGLGLWGSRRIAEAHGGRLEVQSTPGVGSTFRLVLPNDPTRASPAPGGKEEPAGPGQEARAG